MLREKDANSEKDPKTENKEIGFGLVFRDTFNFLSTSLDKLVESVKKSSDGNLPILANNLKDIDGKLYSNEIIELASCKGVFPYDYMKDAKSLMLEGLPDKTYFKSILKNEDIESFDENRLNERFEYATTVFKTIKAKNLLDYMLFLS